MTKCISSHEIHVGSPTPAGRTKRILENLKLLAPGRLGTDTELERGYGCRRRCTISMRISMGPCLSFTLLWCEAPNVSLAARHRRRQLLAVLGLADRAAFARMNRRACAFLRRCSRLGSPPTTISSPSRGGWTRHASNEAIRDASSLQPTNLNIQLSLYWSKRSRFWAGKGKKQATP